LKKFAVSSQQFAGVLVQAEVKVEVKVEVKEVYSLQFAVSRGVALAQVEAKRAAHSRWTGLRKWPSRKFEAGPLC
jgi:hypothetical protein